ncbi:MAG: hypothetical protein KKC66_00035 [Candidatus Omnitrophica bacterium]|nr:hypothetical protein [Candidatus Omnitrophota bacterium]MBU1932282.1 hypothetical protein [Candidatus Omnitrophota bacterium]
MKDRIFYELDPYNRLIRLYYEVYKPCNGTPQKIEFSGKYRLDKDHNLIFSLF